MLKIEFFHDVICSFCFPMSARMRRLNDQFEGKLEIEHRSFALGWEVEQFERQFGSHEAVKPEVLNHWVQANQNDDDHRFNIEGMRNEDFLFPTSKPGLIAAKAAQIAGDSDDYWNVFDKLQEGLFVKNVNIQDDEVIANLVKETDVDFQEWEKAYQDPETENRVLEDLALVQAYQVQGAPALVINQKYLISGAQPYEYLVQAIEQIAEAEGIEL